MDELVDILDSKGNYTGKTCLKSEAHRLGLFHPTIHVWFYSASGKILLQQRGANKETYPLKWDVSVAGHIGAGEQPKLAAFRETQEEIGVIIDQKKLEKITVLKKEVKHPNGIWDSEFTYVFLYGIDENIPVKKQENEVEALQWINIKEFKRWIATKNSNFIPNSEERFHKIISAIAYRIEKN